MKKHLTYESKDIDGYDLPMVLKLVEKLKERFGLEDKDFEFDTRTEWDVTYPTIGFERPETEAERISREANEYRMREHRRRTYEILKKEFES